MLFKGNLWIFPIHNPKYHAFAYPVGKYITANNVFFLCILTFFGTFKKMCVILKAELITPSQWKSFCGTI